MRDLNADNSCGSPKTPNFRHRRRSNEVSVVMLTCIFLCYQIYSNHT